MSRTVYFRTGGGPFDLEPVRLDANTVELEFPQDAQIADGAIPDHVHRFARHPSIAVWRPRDRCRWCQAGY